MIEFQAVTYSYRDADRPALVEASFKVGDGAVCALLGPNGSGKSTVLRLVSGWLKPDRGTVLSGAPRRASIAYLSQIERIPFSFSCLEYVLLGRAPLIAPLASPGRHDEQAASAALEAVGLRDFGKRPVTSLSGGELQLVRLARCLAQEASILLLDEPTSMLDPAHALAVARTLERLHAGGATILFSTHDIDLAAFLASEAVLLKDGRLVCAAAAREALRPVLFSSMYGVEFIPKERACTPYPERRG